MYTCTCAERGPVAAPSSANLEGAKGGPKEWGV